jgi:eukaryotic-like serine/threonine-protein kinase
MVSRRNRLAVQIPVKKLTPVTVNTYMEPSIPETIGHYRIIEKIGHGEIGEVFTAYDSGLDRAVNLKVLNPEWCRSTAFVNRLTFKVKQVSQLHHQNIRRVFGLDSFEDRIVIVQEHIEGQTLCDRLRFGHFDEMGFYALIMQICQGLGYAHEHRVVHGNLKSSNLILDESGRVKITDFGLERRIDYIGGNLPEPQIWQVRYLAPEQLRGESPKSPTDVFCLGVIFYEMLAGQLPFNGDTAVAVINNIRYEKPCFESLRRAGVHGDTVLLLAKMMAKNPEDRFINAKEVLLSADAIAVFERNFRPSGPPRKHRYSPRQYLLVSLLMALLLIFWLVVTTVHR